MKVLSLLGCVDPRIVVAWCKRVFLFLEEVMNRGSAP